MTSESLDILALMEETWETLLHRLTVTKVQIEPLYIDVVAPVWRSLPKSALQALLYSNSLMINDRFVLHRRLLDLAREEACGAALLEWALGNCDDSLVDTLKEHRKDELRHSKMYLVASDSVLPERASERAVEFVVDAQEEFGRALDRGNLLPLMASMHMGELRNWMNMNIYLALLSASRAVYSEKLLTVMKSIENDESYHALYTATLVNQWIRDVEGAGDRFKEMISGYAECWWNDVARISKWATVERDRALQESANTV